MEIVFPQFGCFDLHYSILSYYNTPDSHQSLFGDVFINQTNKSTVVSSTNCWPVTSHKSIYNKNFFLITICQTKLDMRDKMGGNRTILYSLAVWSLHQEEIESGFVYILSNILSLDLCSAMNEHIVNWMNFDWISVVKDKHS